MWIIIFLFMALQLDDFQKIKEIKRFFPFLFYPISSAFKTKINFYSFHRICHEYNFKWRRRQWLSFNSFILFIIHNCVSDGDKKFNQIHFTVHTTANDMIWFSRIDGLLLLLYVTHSNRIGCTAVGVFDLAGSYNNNISDRQPSWFECIRVCVCVRVEASCAHANFFFVSIYISLSVTVCPYTDTLCIQMIRLCCWATQKRFLTHTRSCVVENKCEVE